MMGFLSGGNTGLTPEQVARKREIANALAQDSLRTPRTLGDGLNAIGNALLYRKLSGEAAKAESAGQAAANDRFGAIFGALERGGQQPIMQDMAPAPQQPDAVQAALLPPVERAPEPQYRPKMPESGSMAGVVPPDGGPALGSLTVQQPGPNDIVPTVPYQPPMQVAQAGGVPQQPMQQQGQPGVSIGQIWGVMSDPYATPQQKQVAGMMFKQRFEQMSPKYQLEMRKLAMDVQNGSPEAQIELKRRLAEMEQGFEIAKEGRQQASPQAQADLAKTQAQTEAAQMQVQQARREAEQVSQKQEAAQTQAKAKSMLMTQEIDRAIGLIDNGGSIAGTTGFGSLAAGIPGTDARSLSGMLDTIKANIGFKELNDMRAASPTGGALGNVTEKELAFLQAVAGKLDQGGDAQVLKDNLNRLRNAAQRVIHQGIPEQELDQMMRGLSFEKSGPAIGTVENGYRFKGGNPADPNSWEQVQ